MGNKAIRDGLAAADDDPLPSLRRSTCPELDRMFDVSPPPDKRRRLDQPEPEEPLPPPLSGRDGWTLGSVGSPKQSNCEKWVIDESAADDEFPARTDVYQSKIIIRRALSNSDGVSPKASDLPDATSLNLTDSNRSGDDRRETAFIPLQASTEFALIQQNQERQLHLRRRRQVEQQLQQSSVTMLESQTTTGQLGSTRASSASPDLNKSLQSTASAPISNADKPTDITDRGKVTLATYLSSVLESEIMQGVEHNSAATPTVEPNKNTARSQLVGPRAVEAQKAEDEASVAGLWKRLVSRSNAATDGRFKSKYEAVSRLLSTETAKPAADATTASTVTCPRFSLTQRYSAHLDERRMQPPTRLTPAAERYPAYPRNPAAAYQPRPAGNHSRGGPTSDRGMHSAFDGAPATSTVWQQQQQNGQSYSGHCPQSFAEPCPPLIAVNERFDGVSGSRSLRPNAQPPIGTNSAHRQLIDEQVVRPRQDADAVTITVGEILKRAVVDAAAASRIAAESAADLTQQNRDVQPVTDASDPIDLTCKPNKTETETDRNLTPANRLPASMPVTGTYVRRSVSERLLDSYCSPSCGRKSPCRITSGEAVTGNQAFVGNGRSPVEYFQQPNIAPGLQRQNATSQQYHNSFSIGNANYRNQFRFPPPAGPYPNGRQGPSPANSTAPASFVGPPYRLSMAPLETANKLAVNDCFAGPQIRPPLSVANRNYSMRADVRSGLPYPDSHPSVQYPDRESLTNPNDIRQNSQPYSTLSPNVHDFGYTSPVVCRPNPAVPVSPKQYGCVTDIDFGQQPTLQNTSYPPSFQPRQTTSPVDRFGPYVAKNMEAPGFPNGLRAIASLPGKQPACGSGRSPKIMGPRQASPDFPSNGHHQTEPMFANYHRTDVMYGHAGSGTGLPHVQNGGRSPEFTVTHPTALGERRLNVPVPLSEKRPIQKPPNRKVGQQPMTVHSPSYFANRDASGIHRMPPPNATVQSRFEYRRVPAQTGNANHIPTDSGVSLPSATHSQNFVRQNPPPYDEHRTQPLTGYNGPISHPQTYSQIAQNSAGRSLEGLATFSERCSENGPGRHFAQPVVGQTNFGPAVHDAVRPRFDVHRTPSTITAAAKHPQLPNWRKNVPASSTRNYPANKTSASLKQTVSVVENFPTADDWTKRVQSQVVSTPPTFHPEAVEPRTELPVATNLSSRKLSNDERFGSTIVSACGPILNPEYETRESAKQDTTTGENDLLHISAEHIQSTLIHVLPSGLTPNEDTNDLGAGNEEIHGSRMKNVVDDCAIDMEVSKCLPDASPSSLPVIVSDKPTVLVEDGPEANLRNVSDNLKGISEKLAMDEAVLSTSADDRIQLSATSDASNNEHFISEHFEDGNAIIKSQRYGNGNVAKAANQSSGLSTAGTVQKTSSRSSISPVAGVVVNGNAGSNETVHRSSPRDVDADLRIDDCEPRALVIDFDLAGETENTEERSGVSQLQRRSDAVPDANSSCRQAVGCGGKSQRRLPTPPALDPDPEAEPGLYFSAYDMFSSESQPGDVDADVNFVESSSSSLIGDASHDGILLTDDADKSRPISEPVSHSDHTTIPSELRRHESAQSAASTTSNGRNCQPTTAHDEPPPPSFFADEIEHILASRADVIVYGDGLLRFISNAGASSYDRQRLLAACGDALDLSRPCLVGSAIGVGGEAVLDLSGQAEPSMAAVL